MNFVFISPNFPNIYSHFVRELHARGVNVLGIGDQPYESLNQELKENLTEYCYVSDMNRFDWMVQTVDYLQKKYGTIDFLESNNEYWMRSDAKLREWFNIKGGYRLADLDLYQCKSGMKKFFNEAGVKTARYIVVSTLEESRKFIEQVCYPVFAKPDSGVGAADTYKISSDDELARFHQIEKHERYIMEEFIKGEIISFDGIANSKSEVVLCYKETFPTPIAEIVHNDEDLFYFAESAMTKSYKDMGKRIVKAFNLQSRCFHIELWRLLEDKPGLAKKGDIIALEANLRSPGGNTPDLLNLVSRSDYYASYAEMIVHDVHDLPCETENIAFSINRKNKNSYVLSDEEMLSKYSHYLKEQGTYPEAFRDAMGDRFYLFLFKKDDPQITEFLASVLAQK